MKEQLKNSEDQLVESQLRHEEQLSSLQQEREAEKEASALQQEQLNEQSEKLKELLELKSCAGLMNASNC